MIEVVFNLISIGKIKKYKIYKHNYLIKLILSKLLLIYIYRLIIKNIEN